MLTVAQATREIISQRPFIEDALTQGIINYNSLAKIISEEVVFKTGKSNIKETTISMALRRIGEQYKTNITTKTVSKIKDFLGSDTSLRYDLFEITYPMTGKVDFAKVISKIFDGITVSPNDFLSVTKGRSEVTIITNARNKSKVRSVFNNLVPKNETHNLAALTITIPEDSLEVPGLFYFFTKALTMEGINIVELISTFSEMQFVLEEDFIADAARIIRNLVKSAEPVF